MNDPVRQALKQLLAAHGHSLARDSRRCEAWLSDLCPQQRKHIHVLIQAMKFGVVNDLIAGTTGIPTDVLMTRLSKKLHDDSGISEDLAKWAVETWVLALGIAPEPVGEEGHSKVFKKAKPLTTVAQTQYVFHKDPEVPGTVEYPDAPSVEYRRWMVDFVTNPDCPLAEYLGNDHARRRLATAAFEALDRGNHCCSDLALFLSGPASSGKLSLAKLFAELLELPFVEIQSWIITTTNKLFTTICTQMKAKYMPIRVGSGKNRFRLPPCIIFVDEVHSLPQEVFYALLRACEGKEGTMTTENGKLVDCRSVCWFVATSERDELFHSFDSRFEKLQLEKETAQAKITNLTYRAYIRTEATEDEVRTALAPYGIAVAVLLGDTNCPRLLTADVPEILYETEERTLDEDGIVAILDEAGIVAFVLPFDF